MAYNEEKFRATIEVNSAQAKAQVEELRTKEAEYYKELMRLKQKDSGATKEQILQSLDLSKNTALEKVDCFYNQLTSLDVTGCTVLTNIDCTCNKIAGAAMDAFVESLPTVSSGQILMIDNKNEQNVITTTQASAAKAKGWKPLAYIDGGWKEYDGSEPTAINNINAAKNNNANADPKKVIKNGKLHIGSYTATGQRVR